MPPGRPPKSNNAPQRKAFKPPRPAASTSKASSSKKTNTAKSAKAGTTTTTKGRPARPSAILLEASASDASDDEDEDTADLDDFIDDEVDQDQPGTASTNRRRSQPEYVLAELDDDEDPPLTIPSELLTTLLKHHFKTSKMGLREDAKEVASKYIEVFVREAIARAAFERENDREGKGNRGFLEVEDLEKGLPQMLLDF